MAEEQANRAFTEVFRQDCISRLQTRLEYALSTNTPDFDYMLYVVSQERVFISAAGSNFLPEVVKEALDVLYLNLSTMLTSTGSPYSVFWDMGPHGRSRLNITPEYLNELFEIGLSVSYVANILRVSKSTIHRRMCEYGISVSEMYSALSDDDLDTVVRNIKSRFPHAGYRTVKGCLQAEGHRVQWMRVKGSMHRVDTAGILSRLSSMGCVVRRKYSVPGPLCMQHIDTNHKLIRYNIVIFGGIDGFSRKIMYLNAASNNRASTAYTFFLDGVRKFGWPYKVRADQGVENVDIAQAMFSVRGTGCRSFISGKSVHNQRIERLWRDVWLAVTQLYYGVLHDLEEDGLLDITNSLHLYCVHYTFLPRLKDDLSRFANGWDNHPIRTEQNMTPNQLWHLGLMQNPVREPEMSEGIQIDDIDWEDSGLTVQQPNQGVVLPELDCPLDPERLELLRLAVQPTASSDSFGRDLYLMCIRHASYLLETR